MQNLFYDRYPLNYEESRDSNPVDILASAIFSAHFDNTVSPSFLIKLWEKTAKRRILC